MFAVSSKTVMFTIKTGIFQLVIMFSGTVSENLTGSYQIRIAFLLPLLVAVLYNPTTASLQYPGLFLKKPELKCGKKQQLPW